MSVFQQLLEPNLAVYDGTLLIFQWGILPPAVWRATHVPADNAGSMTLPRTFRQEHGIYGESGLSRTTQRDGNLRMRFMPSAPILAVLESARLSLDLAAKRGLPFSHPPLSVTDLNSPGRFAFAGKAMIEGPPSSVSFGVSPPMIEYVFILDEVEGSFFPLIPVDLRST